ncbi:protein C-terminal leucine carboxyl O-methyltransferase ppm1 [Aspergillus saccharolyticus JOP 1030-1]|uniref:Leucine carboxyl methyltransferase 1 n=1 Tax=Aspergillus saccharolyticus JOP 1030-1 TaxID=1450539 RepID=A0A318ZVE4_9EURO|nr:leucine carboxyl methyltransferase [Aspergillus saccharolyticus JOP 1030-1]PYH48333.1 leucine carboxyl methyltransferase [Aspergillus saccharolyticus JOP 1030-1]
MSASQIPNLNTLRRGGGRGRFRGRGGGETGRGGGSASKDRVVQGTDNDASVSRLSAVNLGYLEDPFASALCPPGQETRRLPIINRGTYVRTTTIDHLLTHFLHSAVTHHHTNNQATPPSQPTSPAAPKKQIISLGAGSDTRIFRLLTSLPPSHHASLVYHELDFSVNTAAKIRAIRASPLLQRALGLGAGAGPGSPSPHDVTISPAADALHTPHYHLHPVDLRQLAALASSRSPAAKAGGGGATTTTTTTTTTAAAAAAAAAALDLQTLLPGLDTSLPTVLISECCLIYLEPEEADAVVEFFTGVFSAPTTTSTATATTTATPLGLILYEPIRPDDAFGKTMVSNLATRGIQLQTLHRYASLAAQRERLRAHGFVDGQAAADVDFLWERWVGETEKERVAGLEMLDEMEEWRLLARHYCVAWGWRAGVDSRVNVFEGWGLLEGQRE